MVHAVVIGAGLSGLASALFLARRGHTVDLIESDPDDPPQGPEGKFRDWKRRGVAQARHSHNFLGLSRKVLRTEAPDVLSSLQNAGAYVAEIKGIGDAALHADLKLMLARRLPYEGVVREVLMGESGVRLHRGVKACGLIAESNGRIPHVRGVRTHEHGDINGDVVLDCSGRWTESSAWLKAIGARPWVEHIQETPFFYLTRWYVLKPGVRFPEDQVPIFMQLDYGNILAFPADNGRYSLSLSLSMEDPHRSALMDGEKFDAVFAATERFAPWTKCGVAETDPQPLARINNGVRQLVDDAGPVVTGFVLMGDAAMHTNPTLGRGVSLAFQQAQHCAQTIDRMARDPALFAVETQRWNEENLQIWHASQTGIDGAMLNTVRACLRGEAIPAPPPAARFQRALLEAAQDDPRVGVPRTMLGHLLIKPAELLADAELVARVQAHQEKYPNGIGGGPKPLPRAAFEAIATA